MPTALLLVVAACLGGCRTGGEGPGLVRPVQLTDVEGYLEFVVRDRTREQQSKVGAGDTRSDETTFEESVQLQVDGYVYHPNFVEFTLAGLFGLLQQTNEDVFDDRRRSSSEDGDIVEFDLDTHFLRKKPYPGSVFARRHRSLHPRPFQSSLETTTTTYGFTWQYVSPIFPTSLQFSDTDVLLHPLAPEEADGRQRSTQWRFQTGYKFSEYNELSLNYEHRSVEEEPFTLVYDSDEITLGHRWNFGGGHRQRLESELDYFDQRGTFSIRRVRWQETLRLEHSETLRSWYRLEIQDRTQGTLAGVVPIQELSYYLSGTLEHQLYQSLFSQVFVYVQRQEFEPTLDIERFGVQASFDYRKKNRWGELSANYSIRFQTEDRTGSDRAVEIVDERRTFRDPDPIILNNTGIDTASVRITDETRTTLFQPRSDYMIRSFPDRVEIERIPTGRIADQQTVLIDYVFTLHGDFKLDTVNHTFFIRQNFDFGLSPYYRLRRQSQTISPEDATGVSPEDITSHTIGVEFRRGPFGLSAEYEEYDSNIVPFIAVRLRANYRRRFKSGATGEIKARWSDVEYPFPIERRTRFLTVEGRYRHPITETLTVEGAVIYRRERDSLSGNDEGVDFDLSLEWRLRQTEVRLTYDAGKFDDDFSRNEFSRLYVQVKRSF